MRESLKMAVFFPILLSISMLGNTKNDVLPTCFLRMGSEAFLDESIEINESLINLNLNAQNDIDETEIEVSSVFAASESGLKVYNKPSTKSRVLDNLPYGEELTVNAVLTVHNAREDVFYKVLGDTDTYILKSQVLDHKPESAFLDMELLLQYPELPNGCEVTSLAMALNYMGLSVDKCDLSDNYLPKTDDFNADPNEFYINEPRKNGMYCYAGPLVKCVDNLNKEKKTRVLALDITGSKPKALYDLVKEGKPVIVWGTLYMTEPAKHSNGRYSNLHCMVLSGFNETSVTLMDPLYGKLTYDKEVFEKIWLQMESRAVVVYKE